MAKDKPGKRGKGDIGFPAEVSDFLKEVVQDSTLRYDVLRFFQQNPYAILTISDLSTWISREAKPLTDTLQQLSKLGYLTQSYASSAYVLTTDQEKRQQLDSFFSFLEANAELARQLRRQLRPQVEAE